MGHLGPMWGCGSPPLAAPNHVGSVPHGLAKGKAPPFPLYKGRHPSPFPIQFSLYFLSSLIAVPVGAAQRVENSPLYAHRRASSAFSSLYFRNLYWAVDRESLSKPYVCRATRCNTWGTSHGNDYSTLRSASLSSSSTLAQECNPRFQSSRV